MQPRRRDRRRLARSPSEIAFLLAVASDERAMGLALTPSTAAAAVGVAATAAALYYYLTRDSRVHAESVDGIAQPPSAGHIGVAELSMARVRRMASAGFTTPLTRRVEDGVCVISLGAGGDAEHSWGTKCAEHRLYPAAILALDEALTAAESNENVRAVVLTAEGKYFCNGFDLRFLQQETQMMDDVQRATEKLCSRILSFPKPTVAAVNGHACAAGAMLMLCFDEIVMNSERGYCFVPGIDLGLTYSPGMAALMAARLPFALRHSFIVMGKRMTAPQLAEHAVVQPAPPSAVLPTALARAIELKPKATHGDTLRAIKATLYHEAIAALEVEPDAVVMEPTFVPMGFSNIPTGVDKPAVAKAKTPVGSPRGSRRVAKPAAPSQSVEVLKQDTFVAATAQAAADLRKWASTRKTASQLNLQDMDRSGRP